MAWRGCPAASQQRQHRQRGDPEAVDAVGEAPPRGQHPGEEQPTGGHHGRRSGPARRRWPGHSRASPARAASGITSGLSHGLAKNTRPASTATAAGEEVVWPVDVVPLGIFFRGAGAAVEGVVQERVGGIVREDGVLGQPQAAAGRRGHGEERHGCGRCSQSGRRPGLFLEARSAETQPRHRGPQRQANNSSPGYLHAAAAPAK